MGAMQSTRQAEEKVLSMPLVDKCYDQDMQFNQLFGKPGLIPLMFPLGHQKSSSSQPSLCSAFVCAAHLQKKHTHTCLDAV